MASPLVSQSHTSLRHTEPRIHREAATSRVISDAFAKGCQSARNLRDLSRKRNVCPRAYSGGQRPQVYISHLEAPHVFWCSSRGLRRCMPLMTKILTAHKHCKGGTDTLIGPAIDNQEPLQHSSCQAVRMHMSTANLLLSASMVSWCNRSVV
jgi:hypothetical protein